jgi:hypothetical protein
LTQYLDINPQQPHELIKYVGRYNYYFMFENEESPLKEMLQIYRNKFILLPRKYESLLKYFIAAKIPALVIGMSPIRILENIALSPLLITRYLRNFEKKQIDDYEGEKYLQLSMRLENKLRFTKHYEFTRFAINVLLATQINFDEPSDEEYIRQFEQHVLDLKKTDAVLFNKLDEPYLELDKLDEDFNKNMTINDDEDVEISFDLEEDENNGEQSNLNHIDEECLNLSVRPNQVKTIDFQTNLIQRPEYKDIHEEIQNKNALLYTDFCSLTVFLPVFNIQTGEAFSTCKKILVLLKKVDPKFYSTISTGIEKGHIINPPTITELFLSLKRFGFTPNLIFIANEPWEINNFGKITVIVYNRHVELLVGQPFLDLIIPEDINLMYKANRLQFTTNYDGVYENI